MTSGPHSIVPVATSALTPQDVARMGGGIQVWAPQPTFIYPQGVAAPLVQAPAAPEAMITLRDLIRWLAAYGLLGVLLALPIAAVTFCMLGFGDKVFEAEAMLEVNMQQRSLLDHEKNSTGLSEISAPQIINNHRAGLRTRRFLDYLIAHVSPEELEDVVGPRNSPPSWKTRTLVNIGLKDPPKQLYIWVTDHVKIETVRESHLLRIIVDSGDPMHAAAMANHYATFYIQYLTDGNASNAREDYDQLLTKVSEARERLNQAETELTIFSKASDILRAPTSDMSTARADSVEKALSGVEIELLRAEERTRQLRDASRSGGSAEGIRGVGDDPQIVEIQRNLIPARAKRDALLQWCGRRHPRLIAANEEVSNIEADVSRRMQSLVEAASSDERRLGAEKDRMIAQLKEARGEAFDQSPARTKQKQLISQVESLRRLHDDLMRQQDRARLLSEMRGGANLVIKDVAAAPEAPISPRKSIALLAALLSFGFVGLAVPLGCGLWRDMVKPALKAATGPSPVPASVTPSPSTPGMPSPFQPLGSPFAVSPAPPPPQHPSANEPRVFGVLPELMAGDGPVQLSELMHPNTANGTHAMSDIIQRLEALRGGRSGTRVLLITSAAQGEGKSLLAAALAASMCTVGKKVLLMECNPNSPSILNWFPQSVGHSSWTNDLEALRYGLSSLFLLPGHDLPSYAMSDLAEGFRSWVERASVHGLDWVILDGASLLRGFADIAPIASFATDVLVVHDPSRCHSEQAKAGLNAYQQVRGVVINRQSNP
jgi:uncharacterized protein involved in exopolysaccharide biosynthesis/Mrp family chromosome partitioning ATPase